MIGPRQQLEPKLFYTDVNLAERIPPDHPLRRIASVLDFDFVRQEVRGFYGYNGQESVDPIVLMKLMLLLFLEQVPSERELLRRLGYRLDWMWFCGFDIDEPLPDHSVLSKARRRWGPAVFARLFAVVLQQCIDAGLVSGDVLHVDGSCIEGNVDKGKLQPVLRVTGEVLYERLERETEAVRPAGRLTSQSDPEAGVTRKNGQSVCGYKDHRAVDDAEGIITATVTTDAATSEGQVLEEVLDAHEKNTRHRPETLVADKQYGTAENYRRLKDQGVRPCIPHSQRKSQKGKFGHDAFRYDPRKDCFVCPAGQPLHPYHRNKVERRIRYRARKGVCDPCPLRGKCTTSKHGRRVERHLDQDYVDWADGCHSKAQRRRLMRRRKIRAEGSFADATNCHGFSRARWRGLRKVGIQNLLIATAQNLRKLLKGLNRCRRATLSALHRSSVAFFASFRPGRRPTSRARQRLGLLGLS